MSIRVRISLYASLKALEPPSAADHPLASGATVGQVLTHLAVPVEQVKLIFVNGRRADLQQVLADGDRIGVFPPVGGG